MKCPTCLRSDAIEGLDTEPERWWCDRCSLVLLPPEPIRRVEYQVRVRVDLE